MTQVVQYQKKRKRSWWPLIGFLLIVSLLAISYVIAPDVQREIQRALPRLNTRSIAPDVLRWIFTGVIFGILVLIAGLIVAMFAPRRRTLVKEADILKEREEMLVQRVRDKKHQRSVNLEIRNTLRDQDPRSGKME
ncbi:MAG TPA: hypothetical protein VER79_00645 [Candidatus Limnocylindrales bacterium]|nr:hypothetical protein [Candidatus Limnocylindrales bacterium]